MAKKANDLLDVFRRAPEPQGSASGRSRSAKSRRPRDGWDGVVLAPRQVLLVSAAGLLLVVLAFTVGLGFGRRNTQPALARNTAAAWWVRGTLPAVDPTTQRPVPPDALLQELERNFGIRKSHVQVVPDYPDVLRIYVGSWPSRGEAEEYLRLRQLDRIRTRWGSPFNFAEVVDDIRR